MKGDLAMEKIKLAPPAVGLRWFSDNNTWMDCLVVVHKDDKCAAADAILDGINAYWEEEGDEGLCYGDSIEIRLAERGINYDIYYIDYDPEEDWEDEEAWEEFLSSLENNGVEISVVGYGSLYLHECI
jgi:hypothetical protein